MRRIEGAFPLEFNLTIHLELVHEIILRSQLEIRRRVGRQPEIGFPWFKDQPVLASDIYSLGVVFYEVLNSGDFPYELSQRHKRKIAYLKAHLHSNVIAFDHPLSRLVGEMLRKNPADRPTIAEVRSEVDRLWG